MGDLGVEVGRGSAGVTELWCMSEGINEWWIHWISISDVIGNQVLLPFVKDISDKEWYW